jgi:hypothetical protein
VAHLFIGNSKSKFLQVFNSLPREAHPHIGADALSYKQYNPIRMKIGMDDVLAIPPDEEKFHVFRLNYKPISDLDYEYFRDSFQIIKNPKDFVEKDLRRYAEQVAEQL